MAKKSNAKKSDAQKTAIAVDMHSLELIAAAGEIGTFTPAEIYAPLVDAGFVEINPAVKNETGEVATRATQAGIEYVRLENLKKFDKLIDSVADKPQPDKNEQHAPAPVPKNSDFQIENDILMPGNARRGRKTEYPFDHLEVGQSFFVPEDKKIVPSTISAATARYAVPDPSGATVTTKKGKIRQKMVKTRQFVGRGSENNGVKGTRVWRIA